MFLKMSKTDKRKPEQSDDVLKAKQNNKDADREEDISVNQVTNLDEEVSKNTGKSEMTGCRWTTSLKLRVLWKQKGC